ncbi:hypothetical protein ACOMHN_067308 [Nucella lapillus]
MTVREAPGVLLDTVQQMTVREAPGVLLDTVQQMTVREAPGVLLDTVQQMTVREAPGVLLDTVQQMTVREAPGVLLDTVQQRENPGELHCNHVLKNWVLGFNRVPPVGGRVLNMTRDIRRLADNKLARTFFVSPAGNLCFHGTCSYYCDSGHPICGHPDHMEASLMAFLPPEKMARRQTWRNPWKRSYSKHRKAYWEVYSDLCDKVKKRSPYNSGRRLLDIVDMSVLDYLMGNLDRHHYESFRSLGNDSFIIHLDNGRGFGKSHQDEASCMAPLLQCCTIRLSTLQRLVRLYAGPRPLSAVLRQSLTRDAVWPVLLESHLQALDRRLLKVLQAVRTCTLEPDGEGEGEGRRRTLKDVVVDDGVV